jgi:hypothetical protein
MHRRERHPRFRSRSHRVLSFPLQSKQLDRAETTRTGIIHISHLLKRKAGKSRARGENGFFGGANVYLYLGDKSTGDMVSFVVSSVTEENMGRLVSSCWRHAGWRGVAHPSSHLLYHGQECTVREPSDAANDGRGLRNGARGIWGKRDDASRNKSASCAHASRGPLQPRLRGRRKACAKLAARDTTMRPAQIDRQRSQPVPMKRSTATRACCVDRRSSQQTLQPIFEVPIRQLFLDPHFSGEREGTTSGA